MIEKFISKLFEDGKTLKWFHEKYLKNTYEYWFFIRQLSFPWERTKGFTETIQNYLEE
jgi:hypothetical protein